MSCCVVVVMQDLPAPNHDRESSRRLNLPIIGNDWLSSALHELPGLGSTAKRVSWSPRGSASIDRSESNMLISGSEVIKSSLFDNPSRNMFVFISASSELKSRSSALGCGVELTIETRNERVRRALGVVNILHLRSVLR